MNLHRIKNILDSRYYQPTKLSADYSAKFYGEKTEIKNSIGWSLALLIGMIILAIFLISTISETGTRTYTIIFCSFIILIPLYYLIDRRPIMTISSKGILFKNGLFKEWSEIKSTFIDNSDSYLLIIHFNDSGKKIISIRDRTYSLDEISHIIEYYKSKNGR